MTSLALYFLSSCPLPVSSRDVRLFSGTLCNVAVAGEAGGEATTDELLTSDRRAGECQRNGLGSSWASTKHTSEMPILPSPQPAFHSMAVQDESNEACVQQTKPPVQLGE